MAGLHFDITGDNSNFLRKLEEARNGVRSTSKQIEESGVSIEQMFGRMAKGAAKIGAGITAKEIVSNIVRIRGEFQQLEVAFNTMLGSEERANSLMQQLVRTAATTPFDLQSVAKGAKQLLAYGTNAENVNDELITLGNVAAGISVPLGDIVYLYGTLRSQGRAYSVDIKQFAGRGVPIYAELAKVMGVNVEKVNELIEAGKVGFPQVEQAFKNMTSAGGMFNNLMQEQSKTITGQISNIGDSISMMYNNIGKSSEGMINDALSGVSYLVENYEQVGKTILELAAAYGAYKAVLMSVAAYQSFAVGITYSTEIAELSKLIPLKRQSANEDVITAVASGKLTQSKADQVIALRTEIAAKIQSLQATKAQAQAEFSSALATYKASRLRYTVAQEQVALAQSQMQIAVKSGTVEEIAAAKKNAQTASLELNNAAIAKNTAHKGVNIAATNSKSASEAFNTVQTGFNTVSQDKNTISTNILTAAKTKLAAESKALGLSMLANPYVLVAAAVAGLGYTIYKTVTAETELDKAHKRLNDAISDVEKSLTSEVSKLTSLERKLSETKKGTEEYNAIKKTIVDNYGQYYKGLDGEIERVGNLSTVYGQLVEAMRLSIGQRKFESFFKAEQDNLDKTIGEKLDTAYETLIDKYGKTKGGNLYNQFFDSAMHGESLSPSAINDLQNATFIDGKWGSNAKNGILDFENSVFDLRSEISKEMKATEEVLDELKSKFQITEEDFAKMLSGDSTSTNEQPKDNKTLKQLLLDIDASKSKIKELQEQANKGLISSDKIKEEQDVLLKLTSDYKNRTGIEYGSTKSDSASEKLRKEQEELNLLTQKQNHDRIRATEDLWIQVSQFEINAMGESKEKTLAQMKLDHQKELQQLDRQKEDLLQKKIDEAKSLFDAEENKKSSANSKYKRQTFDSSKIKLSKDEENAFSQQKMYVDIKHNSDSQSFYEKEIEAWNSYLVEYGTFQEKKEAITAEYNRKISEESTKGGKESLKKELENKLKEVNFDELKSSINFADIFGDLDAQSTEALTGMRDKLKEIIETSAKDLKPSDLKALQDALQDMDLKISDRNPFEGLKNGIDQYKQSAKALEQAQKDLNTVQQGGEVIIGNYIDKTGKICTKLLTQEQAEKKLSEAQKKRKEAQVELTQSVNSIGEKGQQLVNAGNDICDMLTSLGVEVPEAVSGTLEGLGKVMSSLESIDFGNPFSIISGIAGALAGIGKAIGSIFGITSESDKLQKSIENSECAVKKLTWAFEDLERAREKAEGDGKDLYANQMVDNLKKQQDELKKQQEAEGKKKKSDKEKIDDLSREYEKLGQQIEDLKEEAFNDKLQRNIEASERAVKKLEWVFNDLKRAMDKTLGEAKYDYVPKLLENIRKKQEEILRQIDEENRKTNPDFDRIEELKRSYEEFNQQIEDLIEELKNDIIGGTAQDISSRLGDAFIEAFAKGEDAAKIWKKSVKEIIGDIVKQMLIVKLFEAPIGGILDDFWKKYYGEDVTHTDNSDKKDYSSRPSGSGSNNNGQPRDGRLTEKKDRPSADNIGHKRNPPSGNNRSYAPSQYEKESNSKEFIPDANKIKRINNIPTTYRDDDFIDIPYPGIPTPKPLITPNPVVPDNKPDSSKDTDRSDAIKWLNDTLIGFGDGLEDSMKPFMDLLENFLGDESIQDGVSGQVQSAMTEGTGSQIVGLWNMTALDIREMKNITSEGFKQFKPCFADVHSTVEQTRQIQLNTLRSANNTNGLMSEMKLIRDELGQITKNTKTYKGRG